MKKIILITAFCISFNCHSQVSKTIDKIQDEHQKCLDKGAAMYLCSLEYYNKSDSLLNVVYKKVKTNLSEIKQKELKTKQLIWLKKRDLTFKKLEKENREFGKAESNDYKMICLSQEADFVCLRILELEKIYGVVK